MESLWPTPKYLYKPILTLYILPRAMHYLQQMATNIQGVSKPGGKVSNGKNLIRKGHEATDFGISPAFVCNFT